MEEIIKGDNTLPRYCMFFIEAIQGELDNTDFTIYDELELTVDTYEFPYRLDALILIVDTFKRKGFHCVIPTYKVLQKNNRQLWQYKWNIKKPNQDNVDDLPF